MSEEIKEQLQSVASSKIEEMKESLGKLYEQNEETLAYYVEKIAYCHAVIKLGGSKETAKTLDYLEIGMQSEINKLSYKTGDMAFEITKALWSETLKVLIEAAKGGLA